MQTAMIDPLDDVTPLIEMALAAEARLRPHLVNPPAADADSVPHLNRVTLILGRMVALRKSLRDLRDGAPPAQNRPRTASGNRATDITGERAREVAFESAAAVVAQAHRLIDDLDTAESAEAVESEPSAAEFHPAGPALAENQSILLNTAPSSAKAPPPDDSRNPRALAIVLNSPEQTEATAEKIAAALDRLAAEAGRSLPTRPASPFGYEDIAVSVGPMKFSPALLKQLRPGAASADTS